MGAADGEYWVWVGLKGRSGSQQWTATKLTLDRIAPVLTGLSSQPTSPPLIQLKGNCTEPLASLTYDLANAAGTVTAQPILITSQTYDAAEGRVTLVKFQAFDVALAPGQNTFTVRATDLAGNTTTLPLTYTLSYAGDTTPPAATIYWPAANAKLSGDAFTLRGWVDDRCAAVMLARNGTSGEVFPDVVERNGLRSTVR